ncbi:MAG: hypothetical protein ACR2PX_06725 [Endozoicomonas sp.]|uniref:hypothetical protein n=1 Tax=Endozoicomonas sp. TaxID=1892382 RepID=UPI003D9B630E
MSNPGGLNFESGGVTGLSGATPLPEEKQLKGKWLSNNVGKLNSTETKLPSAHQRSSSVPERSILSRLSTADSSASDIGQSIQDQAGYLLGRPASPETRYKVVDLLVSSVKTTEMLSMWEHQGLDPVLAAEMKILQAQTKVSDTAVKKLGLDKGSVVKQQTKKRLEVTEAFTKKLAASLKTSDPQELRQLFERTGVSNESIKHFVANVAKGFGSAELKGWNGIPEQTKVVELPEGYGSGFQSLSVSVKTASKGRPLSSEEVSSLADTTAVSLLEAKQKQSPDPTVKKELETDEKSVIQDANRMLVTFEESSEQEVQSSQHTGVLFDSRLLKTQPGSSEAGQDALKKRKEVLENQFASCMDTSDASKAVFKTFSHQGAMNELVNKLYPMLPKQPTFQQGVGTQAGSDVRFIKQGFDRMQVVATNKYNAFVDPSDTKGKKLPGNGILKMQVQLVRKNDVWTCEHFDISYTDDVNEGLKELPPLQAGTPKHSRKVYNGGGVHKRLQSEGAIQSFNAATRAPGSKRAQMGKSGWYVADEKTLGLLKMYEQKERVGVNLKNLLTKWETALSHAEGAPLSKHRLALKGLGASEEALKYDQLLAGLATSINQSSQESDIYVKSIRATVDSDQVSDEELVDLFADELGECEQLRDQYRERTAKAFQAFQKTEPESYEVDLSLYHADKHADVRKLTDIYKGSYDWHVEKHHELKEKLDNLDSWNSVGAIRAELSALKKLPKESKGKIDGYRGSGSEAKEVQESLKMTDTQKMEFTLLSDRTFVYQKIFLDELEQLEIALAERLSELEGAQGRSAPDDGTTLDDGWNVVTEEPDRTDLSEPREVNQRGKFTRGRMSSDTEYSFLGRATSNVTEVETLPAEDFAVTHKSLTEELEKVGGDRLVDLSEVLLGESFYGMTEAEMIQNLLSEADPLELRQELQIR